MKHLLHTIIIFIISIGYTYGQTYNINTYNGQTISSCSGTFYDSGGPTGTYSAGESYVVTLSPTTNFSNLTFNSFNVTIGDMIEIFDGADVNAPLIAIYNNGNSPIGQTIRASFLGTQGKLTIRWTSVGSAAGWDATLSCGIPCQSFNTIITQSTPPFTIDSGIYFIDICPGDTVVLRASANFYMNNFYYHQDTTTTDFTWNFGNNNNVQGQNVTTTLNNVQGYNAYILATDTIGCNASQATEVRIRVSTPPDFSGTVINPNLICQYDSTHLLGAVAPTPWSVTPSLSVAGTTYLPDGSGVSYTSNLTFTGFGTGQVLQNTADLLRVFMEIEHSYIGDLNLVLKCPNNSSVTLKSYPGGGGTYLGEPIDNNATQTAGLGYMYNWSAGGSTTMAAAFNTYSYNFIDVLGTSYNNANYMPPSTVYPPTSTATGTLPIVQYKPETPITNLLGCPMNGTWKIVVTDNLAIDNGFIFSWGIDFASSLLPVAWGYTPIIDTTFWNYGIGDTLFAELTSPGQQAMVYTMVDNAGCAYDTTFMIDVNPAPQINLGNDTNICLNNDITLYSNNDIPNSTLLWSTGANTDTINIIPTNTQSYSLIATSPLGCVEHDTIEVVLVPLPVIQISDDTLICIGTKADLQASGGTLYQWSNGDNTNNISVWPNSTITYQLTVTDINTCINDTTVTVTVAPLPTIAITNDTVVCEGTDAYLKASGGVIYNWNNGANTANQTVSPIANTTYTVVVEDANKCIDSADVLVEILDNPIAKIFSNFDTICRNGTINLVAEGGMSYKWSNNEITSSISETATTSKSFAVLAINTQDATNCYDTTSVYVVVENCAVYVPSAFTPNGDGLNDKFQAAGIISTTADFNFYIYSRSGQLLFHTNDLTEGWDGTFEGNDVTTGVYTWMIQVTESSIDSYQITGTVTLLR